MEASGGNQTFIATYFDWLVDLARCFTQTVVVQMIDFVVVSSRN